MFGTVTSRCAALGPKEHLFARTVGRRAAKLGALPAPDHRVRPVGPRRLRAGAAEVPGTRLSGQRHPHHLPRAALDPVHPALQADAGARDGQQPLGTHRRLSVVHGAVRDVAPHGLLRVEELEQAARSTAPRASARSAGSCCRSRRRGCGGRPLRVQAGVERVPLCAGVHHRREPAHAARGPSRALSRATPTAGAISCPARCSPRCR